MTIEEAIGIIEDVILGTDEPLCVEALSMALEALRAQQRHEKLVPVTREQLAAMDYSAPPDAPNINYISWYDLKKLSPALGDIRSKHITGAFAARKIVYDCPMDLLKVRGIGPAIAASLVGKVRFGLED